MNRRIFTLETGYFNLRAIKTFIRLTDLILLAKFQNLKYLRIEFSHENVPLGTFDPDYNYEITYRPDVPAPPPSPTPPNVQIILPKQEFDKKTDWRFQPSIEQTTAIKLKIVAEAQKANFQALRLGFLSDGMLSKTKYVPTGV